MTAINQRARAGAAYIGERPQSAHRDGLVNALGAELFGDSRLRGFVTCRLCGCLGEPGDDCGRAPAGHVLTADNGSEETR